MTAPRSKLPPCITDHYGSYAEFIAKDQLVSVQLVNGEIIRVSMLDLIQASGQGNTIRFLDRPRGNLQFIASSTPSGSFYNPSAWIELHHIKEILD